ncbi:STAS domain-containing protein [Streptomyces sp. NPDC058611]|uniref:STAS domain-containing protein n=1 Tax=unclassified Streptomyces TaxID=2593676 RepID=UPI00365AC493
MDVDQYAQGVVLGLRGELDYDSIVQLHEAAAAELVKGAGAGLVVVDCAGLSFCDSSGIGALVQLHRRLSAQGRVLKVTSVPGSVARLFRLTGLDQVLSVHAKVSEALQEGVRSTGTDDGGERPARHHEGQSA